MANARKITAADLTFGVEIECTLPYQTITGRNMRIGPYGRGCQVPGMPPGWVACRDSSLNARNNHEAVEIVSPVLKGEDGIRQVMAAAAWLREAGAKVNRTCGLHVHVGFDRGNEEQLGRLAGLVARHEKALFASTGTKWRERNDYFCKPIKTDGFYTAKFRDKRDAYGPAGRYFTLNITSHKPTVEFRVFSGTTKATKIIGYVWLCLGLVEKAINTNSQIKWELGYKTRRRKGEGANAMAWLMEESGWRRANDHHFGVIEVEDGPSLRKVRDEMNRLATKYDSADPDNDRTDDEDEDAREGRDQAASEEPLF